MSQQPFDHQAFIAKTREDAKKPGAVPVLFVRIELDDVVEEFAIFNPGVLLAEGTPGMEARAVLNAGVLCKTIAVASQAIAQRRRRML